MSNEDVVQEVIDLAAACQFDPHKWSLSAWDWGVGALEKWPGPKDWQADINRAIRDHLRDKEHRFEPLLIAVASGHGIGKLQKYDDIVPCPQGMRRWGDLREGDSVFGGTGRPVKIRRCHHFKSVPIYRVTFDDRSFVDVSSGHLWNVRGRQERRYGMETWRTLETIQLLELGVKRSNGCSEARQWEIPIQGAAQFQKRKQSVHPYLMGVWLGDGTRGQAKYSKPYPEIADRIRSLGYSVSDMQQGAHSILGCSSLFRGGVFDCASFERYIPDDYLLSDIDDRMELLRGLCDTDGECHQSGSIGYSTTSRRLADDVIFLARSLGCKAMLQPTVKDGWYPDDNGDRVLCRDCYRVTINAPFNPFTLKHRKDAYKPSDARYLKRWIESIEPIGNEDGMCITVDAEDGLYLARDFIVTHNSAEMGMLSNWAMSCWDDAKVLITANTENQLRTKTSPEVAKWFRTSLTSDWFDVATLSIKSKDAGHNETWRMDFVPWSENNTEAFAGLHNEGKIILVLFDEASKISDKIFETIEGALTDENTVIIWVCFGNPTRNIGRFRECFRRFKHRWITKQIDSRTVEGTNKAQIQKWVDDYGEDSDFVKVRVRGLFPNMSAKQFISESDVDGAYGKHVREEAFSFAPVIIGVDPAWEGDDDFVIVKRQGLVATVLRVIPKNDNDVQMANLIANLQDEHKADAVFVDAGYGTGIVSAGNSMGRSWQLVWFSGASSKQGYLNKRAEMWGDMRDWLKQGGAIPPDPVLRDELISVETVPRMDGKIQMVAKKDMKDDGLPSPNRADALALTFAFPVMKASRVQQRQQRRADYDPYAM